MGELDRARRWLRERYECFDRGLTWLHVFGDDPCSRSGQTSGCAPRFMTRGAILGEVASFLVLWTNLRSTENRPVDRLHEPIASPVTFEVRQSVTSTFKPVASTPLSHPRRGPCRRPSIPAGVRPPCLSPLFWWIGRVRRGPPLISRMWSFVRAEAQKLRTPWRGSVERSDWARPRAWSCAVPMVRLRSS